MSRIMVGVMVKDYLDSIIRPLLASPEVLVITESEDLQGVLLTVSIQKADMGRIIGRKGETIGAVRSLIHTRGSQDGKRVSVKVLEPSI